MNIDKKEGHGAPIALFSVNNDKGTLPGQQIGLYNNAEKKDVSQAVLMLNPDTNSMKSRG
ncbi:hypothetical protein [Bacteroides fluxus]|uniref:hypothetical protein n=1 Tax=Bacteroides fluxus TaxID=626930 RepID=UPI0023F2A4A0|nr:hypothetical protein [Bacteroides fluxus]